MVGQRNAVSGPGSWDPAGLLTEARAQLWRAPELAGMLASSVATTAQRGSDVALAEGLRALARGVSHGGVAAVQEAIEVAARRGASELEAVLRIGLARAANSAGRARDALTVLRPMLVPGRPPALLGMALGFASATLAPLCWRDELHTVLVNAERLCVLDDGMDAEGATLARADVLANAARAARIGGDHVSAAGFARDGLRVLDGLGASIVSGSGVLATLRLELLLSLTAEPGAPGELAELVRAGTASVFEPVRAGAAAATAWLAHALATVPSAELHSREPAALLAEAVHIGQSYEEYDVVAPAARELAILQEQAGAPGAARSVRVADYAAGRHRLRMATIAEQLDPRRMRGLPEDGEDEFELDDFEEAVAPEGEGLETVIDELLAFAVELGGFQPPNAPGGGSSVAAAAEPEPTRTGSAVPGPESDGEPEPAAAMEQAVPLAEQPVATDLTEASLSVTASREPDEADETETGEAPPGLAHLSGLVVTEGGGGRRRARKAERGDDSAARVELEQDAGSVSVPGQDIGQESSVSAENPIPGPRDEQPSEQDSASDRDAVSEQETRTEQDDSLGFVDLLAKAMDAYHADQPEQPDQPDEPERADQPDQADRFDKAERFEQAGGLDQAEPTEQPDWSTRTGRTGWDDEPDWHERPVTPEPTAAGPARHRKPDSNMAYDLAKRLGNGATHGTSNGNGSGHGHGNGSGHGHGSGNGHSRGNGNGHGTGNGHGNGEGGRHGAAGSSGRRAGRHGKPVDEPWYADYFQADWPNLAGPSE